MARVRKNTNTESEIDETIASINKVYGERTAVNGNRIVQPDRISTGVFLLDLALLGGIPSNRCNMFTGNKHSGKAGRETDRVMTPKGWVMYKDIKVGTLVAGLDGNFIRVIAVHRRGVLPMLKVSFTDKSSIIVSEDHLWTVQSARQAHNACNNWVVRSTKDIDKIGCRTKSNVATYRIPIVAAINHEKRDTPIDPYLLGILLSNGSIKSAEFACKDLGIINYIKQRSPKVVIKGRIVGKEILYGISVGATAKNKYQNRIMEGLENLGLWGAHFRYTCIPEIYLRSSIEDRVAILNGVMDHGGTVVYRSNRNICENYTAEYRTYSKQLALDIQEIINSLGGIASIVVPYTEEEYLQYRISMRLPGSVDLFKASKAKVSTYTKDKRNPPVRSIASIEPDRPCKAICITVDSPDGLYVTENHTVTHNSTISSKCISSVQKLFPEKSAVLLDIEDTFDADWAEQLGVDTERLKVVSCQTGEMAVDCIDAIIGSKETALVVVDSIAALVPTKEVEDSAEDMHVGIQSRLITRMVRKITSCLMKERKRGHLVTILYINQFRALIGSRFPTNSIPGGRALGYANSVEVIIKNKEQEGNDEFGMKCVTHNEHSFQLVKNKVCNSIKAGEFKLIRVDDEDKGLYSGDVENSKSLIRVAKIYNIYTGAGQGQRLKFNDHNYTFKNMEHCANEINQDEELRRDLWVALIRIKAKSCKMKPEFIEKIDSYIV